MPKATFILNRYVPFIATTGVINGQIFPRIMSECSPLSSVTLYSTFGRPSGAIILYPPYPLTFFSTLTALQKRDRRIWEWVEKFCCWNWPNSSLTSGLLKPSSYSHTLLQSVSTSAPVCLVKLIIYPSYLVHACLCTVEIQGNPTRHLCTWISGQLYAVPFIKNPIHSHIGLESLCRWLIFRWSIFAIC